MDQLLNILNPMSSTIFWSIIVFGILALVVWRFVLKPVNRAMEARQKEIEGSLQEADRQKQQAQAMLEEQKRMLDKAREQSLQIIEKGEQEALQIKEELQQQAQKKAAALLEDAQEQIGQQKEAAWSEVRQKAVDMAIQAASRVLEREVSREDHVRLIEDSLKELDEEQHE